MGWVGDIFNYLGSLVANLESKPELWEGGVLL